jgi:membrane-associated phospholipid phosphatase
MQYFFSSIPDSIKKSFTWYYGLPHIFAIGFTYVFVASGFDWFYFVHMQSKVIMTLFRPAIVLGGILPIIIPIALIGIGYFLHQKQTAIVGWALAQAMILGSFISSVYKAFTGRIPPDLHNLHLDSSHNFNFGFYEHGIFWGWPSSHTTIAFAMAVALIQLFPTNKRVHTGVLLYAFYIGIGVSFSIHWFSEFIAGAFIGSVIGLTVGKNFQDYFFSSSKVNDTTASPSISHEA